MKDFFTSLFHALIQKSSKKLRLRARPRNNTNSIEVVELIIDILSYLLLSRALWPPYKAVIRQEEVQQSSSLLVEKRTAAPLKVDAVDISYDQIIYSRLYRSCFRKLNSPLLLQEEARSFPHPVIMLLLPKKKMKVHLF